MGALDLGLVLEVIRNEDVIFFSHPHKHIQEGPKLIDHAAGGK